MARRNSILSPPLHSRVDVEGGGDDDGVCARVVVFEEPDRGSFRFRRLGVHM
jgi:hypothetical protein